MNLSTLSALDDPNQCKPILSLIMSMVYDYGHYYVSCRVICISRHHWVIFNYVLFLFKALEIDIFVISVLFFRVMLTIATKGNLNVDK